VGKTVVGILESPDQLSAGESGIFLNYRRRDIHLSLITQGQSAAYTDFAIVTLI